MNSLNRAATIPTRMFCAISFRRGDGAVTAGRAAGAGGSHLLDDHLAAVHLGADIAACKAHDCGQHQCHGTACHLAAIDMVLFLFGRFRSGRLLGRHLGGRHRAASIRGSSLRLRLVVVLVGSVHAAAAHIGVTGAACRVIGRGIVVFPFVLIHIDTSFPEKALSPGNCAPWNCSYCIHQL